MNDWLDAEQHVERAHELYDAGRWDEAENELRQALSLNPYQAEWHFNLGLTLEAAGRSADAADAFRRCSELQKDAGQADANALILAGSNLLGAGQAERALELLDEAEQLEPMNIEISVNRIEALAELDRYEDAEECFYLGQQIDPECPELYLTMGNALQRGGHRERAVWCLREAARLDPSLPRVRAQLASAYAQLGRSERARQLYIQELRVDPGDTSTLLDLGDLLADMHRPDEACEKYARVLELDPSNADAHAALGDLAYESGDLAEALVHYDVVLRLDKAYPTVRVRLAGAMLERGRDEDRPRVRELLAHEVGSLGSRQPNDAPRRDGATRQTRSDEELEELGQALLQAGMRSHAESVYREIAGRTPSSYRAWHGISVAQLESGALDEGIVSAKRSLQLRPSFVPAMHNLVLAYYRKGQFIRARYWLKQAMRQDPDDPALRRLRLRLRARTLIGLGRWLSKRADRVARVVLWPLLRPARD